MEKNRLSALAVALFAAFVAGMFLATAGLQVVAVAQSSTNTMRVIVMAGESPQALNDVMKSMKDLGATNIKKLQIINAVSGVVSAHAYQTIRGMNAVVAVVEDHVRHLDPGPYGKGDGAVPEGKADSVDPYIEPEALNVTHADWGQSLGFSGQGIKVGFVDTGVDYTHPDLAPAIASYVDTTGAGLKDKDGHGTGTASMVGAQGYYVYNSVIGQYMRVKGMAPDARIYAAKVFDKSMGMDSTVIAGIEWAVANDVDVLSCSVGMGDFISDGLDPISLAMQKAVESGVTVFVSAANEGPGQGTVNSPATAMGVISVGASTFFRDFSQEGFLMPVGSKWRNDQVIEWSSRGPTADGRMSPDIMSPGAFGWALAPTFYAPASVSKYVQSFGGTSQASPVAAGCTALLMSAYKAEISDDLPPPAWWERLIRSTAANLGYPGFDQTSGLIDVAAALDAMLERKPSFLLSDNEWSVDASGVKTKSITVENVGTSAQTITITPTEFVEMSGETLSWEDTLIYSNDARHEFSIPDGTDFLEVKTTWSQGGAYVSFRNAVYDSEGAFVTYGPTYGGYGRLAESQVSLTGPDPPVVGDAPWEVWIFPRGGMMPYADTLVMTKVTFYQEVPGGWVDSSAASVEVAAGETATFTLSLNSMAPQDAGTYFTQVRISNGDNTATIPVALTVPVAFTGNIGAFQGTFKGSTISYTGGEYYYFHFMVPDGTSNILATASWMHEGNVVWIWLLSPDSQIMVVNGGGNDLRLWMVSSGLGIFDQTIKREQLVWSNPEPGEWKLGVFAGGFWGGAFTEEFQGKITLNADLYNPDSMSFTGKAGKTYSQTLTVSNIDGVAPIEVFGMAGSSDVLTEKVSSFKGNLAPSHYGAEDSYYLPIAPNTASVEAKVVWAVGECPLSVSLEDPTGGSAGTSASPEYGTQEDGSASVSVKDPMPGLWRVFVNYFGTSGFEPVAYSLKVTKISPEECMWLSASATPSAPVTIEPGSTADVVVTVTIPSSAKPGTMLGAIYLDTTSGDTLGVMPVTLTVE